MQKLGKRDRPVFTQQQAHVVRDIVRERCQAAGGPIAFGAALTRIQAADRAARKAAGITTPDVNSASNRMVGPDEAAADAARRLGRPETAYGLALRESAERQAAALQQIKDIRNGVQVAPSTGPRAL